MLRGNSGILEKWALCLALRANRYSPTYAAKWLGLTRRTMHYRMHKYDITNSEKVDKWIAARETSLIQKAIIGRPVDTERGS